MNINTILEKSTIQSIIKYNLNNAKLREIYWKDLVKEYKHINPIILITKYNTYNKNNSYKELFSSSKFKDLDYSNSRPNNKEISIITNNIHDYLHLKQIFINCDLIEDAIHSYFNVKIKRDKLDIICFLDHLSMYLIKRKYPEAIEFRTICENSFPEILKIEKRSINESFNDIKNILNI